MKIIHSYLLLFSVGLFWSCGYTCSYGITKSVDDFNGRRIVVDSTVLDTLKYCVNSDCWEFERKDKVKLYNFLITLKQDVINHNWDCFLDKCDEEQYEKNGGSEHKEGYIGERLGVNHNKPGREQHSVPNINMDDITNLEYKQIHQEGDWIYVDGIITLKDNQWAYSFFVLQFIKRKFIFERAYTAQLY